MKKQQNLWLNDEILNYYDWQIKVITHAGNVAIRGSRQSGKSESVAERILYNARKYPGSTSLIIAASERQENYLLDKVKRKLGEDYKFKERATLTKLHLNHEDGNSIIYKYPVGRTGMYVKGLSEVDFLYIDEAHFLHDKVLLAILPMLAVARGKGRGWVTVLSTTDGPNRGYFYKACTDPNNDFEKFHIPATVVPHITKEYLEEQRKTLSEKDFNEIWMAEFIDNYYNYFHTKYIDKAMNFKFWKIKEYDKTAQYFLGVDPARYGKDETAYVIAEIKGDKVKVVYCETTNKTALTETAMKINEFHTLFNFNKIFIDDGGVGGGLMDILERMIPRKVRALNNASKETDKILKEDLYSNTLRLLQTEKLTMIDDEKLRKSLLSITWEDGKLTGNYDHLAEALNRACWGVKEKRLNTSMIKIF